MVGDNARIHQRAQQHLAQGRPQQAEEMYRHLLGQANIIDYEYNEWLDGAARTYRTLSRDREAGFIYVYLGRLDKARDLFPRDRAPADAARLLELQARPVLTGSRERAAPLMRDAADLYASAGYDVLAAIAYTEAGEPESARWRWGRVLEAPRLRGRTYEQGLVHFNLGLLCRRAGMKEDGQRHFVQAQRLLEEVADEFEASSERERAFDCYAVLLQLGKELKSYENLAEGYINCIRVLKEDNLKFYVLQYYEDFLRISLEQEEFHAAATMFREAADYTRRVGLIWDREYMRRSGETWWKAADKNQRKKGPVKLTENAYLSAIDAFNAIGDFNRVRETYRRLGELDVGEKKQQRYQRLLHRYAHVGQDPLPEAASFPEYLRHQHAYPDIWYLDLVEWQYDGDPAAVCASIVGDPKYADMVRRCALNVLLTALDAQHRELRAEQEAPKDGAQPEAAAPEQRLRTLLPIARGLGEMQSYASLRPLEKLYEDADPRVRRAAVEALRCLCYKRTFQLVMRGLRDSDDGVRQAALRVMQDLHFPHAVDPLIRIFREHHDEQVKIAALESLGRVGDLCAGEFLIEVLRHEAEPLPGVARRLLMKHDNPDILPILRRYREMETGPVREALEGILRGK